MADLPKVSYNFINTTISFEEVIVGSSPVKYYTFKNRSHTHVTYIVTRDSQTNPIYHVFDVNKYETVIEPGREFTLKVTYTPNIAGSKDYDYFSVVDSLQNFARICVKGECIGPRLSCSIRNLIFHQTPSRKNFKQVFELKNDSRVAALYQFDCAQEEQGVFVVKPLNGNLKPGEHQLVTVKFLPEKIGWYAKQLCCLILHHDPILVNLVGQLSDSDYDPEVAIRFYPFPYHDTVGFKGYLSDSVTFKQTPPPVSLTVNHLDFGQMLPISSCQTLTTCFTNHLEYGIEVKWENTKLFWICPEELQISANKAALYECRFHPIDSSRLYSGIINGHVMWTSSDKEAQYSVNAPIPISLRLIGHSFPKNQSWIPSISFTPNCIVLPLTLPTFPTWTTFKIETHGHLPVLYKLLAPMKTNFVMKPMVGLVRNYQIVVVQLQAHSMEPNSYVEKWSIELNGQVERLTPIYVKAQTDIPQVLVGIQNVIEFDAVQPGTQTSIYVPVKNVSCCRLTFEFQPFDNFTIDPISGQLAPNEEMFVACSFTSKITTTEIFQTNITCRLRCLYKEEIIIGEPQDVIITVIAPVLYSELCALPQCYESGDVECGTIIKTSFYLFNFGASNIFFKLKHDHDLESVELRPAFGKCGAREKILVCVQMRILRAGMQTLSISYSNCSNQFDSNKLLDLAPKPVFRVEYNCIYATLQICELVEHSFGDLLGDDDVWTLFKIDELNAALRNIRKGETVEVNLSVPEREVCHKPFEAVFVLENTTKILTDLMLKRRKVCDCELVESHESYMFRQKIYDCPHRDMLTVNIPTSVIPPNSIHSLTFKIKYSLPDENILSYVMELSNERRIILNVNISTIPNDYYVLSTLDDSLDFGFVYIGLREAPVQAFWLYNNTNKDVPFKLDDVEIVKLCNSDGFPVLKCLNCDGFLSPHTKSPILFRFWPIELKTYRVSVPLQLGSKQMVLRMEGNGTVETSKYNFKDIITLPTKCMKNKLLKISVDRLVVEPILVGGSTERLIFIKNLSKTQDLKYAWKPCFLDGLIKITTSNEEACLRPLESHPIVVTITSLSESCKLRMLLHCEVINVKKYKDEKAVFETYKSGLETTAVEFAISDEGKNKINKEEKIVEPPVLEFFSIALPVFVNVVGILDRDSCISADDQMKQKPFDRTGIDVDKFCEDYFTKMYPKETPIHMEEEVEIQQVPGDEDDIDKDMTLHVLENIVSEAVFSDYCVSMLKNLMNEPSPVYSQIQILSRNRDEVLRRETKKLLTQPSLSEMNEICAEAVVEGVHEVFKLGPVAKTHQCTDINK